MEYILSTKREGCIFVKNRNKTRMTLTKILFLYRGQWAFALMNLYPYNNGHIMIAPYAHVPSLTDLTDQQINDLFTLTRHCEQVLGQAIRPEGV